MQQRQLNAEEDQGESDLAELMAPTLQIPLPILSTGEKTKQNVREIWHKVRENKVCYGHILFSSSQSQQFNLVHLVCDCSPSDSTPEFFLSFLFSHPNRANADPKMCLNLHADQIPRFL